MNANVGGESGSQGMGSDERVQPVATRITSPAVDNIQNWSASARDRSAYDNAEDGRSYIKKPEAGYLLKNQENAVSIGESSVHVGGKGRQVPAHSEANDTYYHTAVYNPFTLRQVKVSEDGQKHFVSSSDKNDHDTADQFAFDSTLVSYGGMPESRKDEAKKEVHGVIRREFRNIAKELRITPEAALLLESLTTNVDFASFSGATDLLEGMEKMAPVDGFLSREITKVLRVNGILDARKRERVKDEIRKQCERMERIQGAEHMMVYLYDTQEDPTDPQKKQSIASVNEEGKYSAMFAERIVTFSNKMRDLGVPDVAIDRRVKEIVELHKYMHDAISDKKEGIVSTFSEMQDSLMYGKNSSGELSSIILDSRRAGKIDGKEALRLAHLVSIPETVVMKSYYKASDGFFAKSHDELRALFIGAPGEAELPKQS